MVSKEVAEISLLGHKLPELTLAQIKDYFGRTRNVLSKAVSFISMMRVSMKIDRCFMCIERWRDW